MYASTSLAYVAAMQEHGVPVTYAYISDAHDFHGTSGNQHVAFGPGSAGYVAQLKSYDDAFAAFFQRLAKDDITKKNTLFVFTVDEGDHFVGVNKTNCDGVTVPCQYDPNQVGEINANIDTLMLDQHSELPLIIGHTSTGAPIFSFTVHGDDAPTFYLSGNPDPASTPVRDFERATADLTAVNPYTGNTDTLMKAMADQEEMKALHMYTAGDPLRDPTFAYFADPNYFLTDFPTSTCRTCINPLFAWNHGDIQPEIANTWLGFVGPGVQQNGIDGQVWSDHVDVAPTIYTLLGLTPNWQSDGRVLVQALDGSAVPQSLRAHRGAFVQLSDVYKQLNAPFGSFGMDTLTASTKAIQTGSASSDSDYTAFDQQLSQLRGQRDALAAQISTVLNGAAFQGQTLDEHQAKSLVDQAQSLIRRAASLAGS
jgi:arylsulfatase A-like enzyme